jgi:hypothetical protein
MTILDEAAEQLRQSGLIVTVAPDSPLCATGFDIDGRHQRCFLLLPPSGDYFLIFSSAVPGVDLDKLAVEVLRDLIKMGSSVRLAKLVYSDQSDPGFFFASSECSTENYTAEKLRRRMEACARLAVHVSEILVRKAF